MTSRLVRYRSAPNGPRTHPLLLLLADPVGRHGRTGGQRPGTLARLRQDRLGQPRHRPAPVGQRRTDDVHHSLTRYPRAEIEAQRPSRGPNVVQPFDGGVLRDPALPSGPRGRQLSIGGGKSLSSFPKPCRVDRSAANRRSVQHKQLGTEAFNPVPSLRAGVAELATAVRASRKRKGGDNDEEHHRDQHDRSQQDGGHRTDSTPATSLVAGLASADAQHVATAVDHSGNARRGERGREWGRSTGHQPSRTANGESVRTRAAGFFTGRPGPSGGSVGPIAAPRRGDRERRSGDQLGRHVSPPRRMRARSRATRLSLRRRGCSVPAVPTPGTGRPSSR